MIRPNGPLVTGLRQVVMPVGSRGPSALSTWTGISGNTLVVGGRNNQQWGLYDTAPAVVTADVGIAARAVYGLRESLTLLGLCPIGMTRAGGHVLDADNISAYGFTTGGWGRSNTPMRVPRSVVIIDSSINLEFEATFVDTFNARYLLDLFPLGVEVILVRAPVVFSSAVPVLTAIPTLFQEDIVCNTFSDTQDVYDLTFTTFDPANLQGGQVLFVGIGGYSGGYETNRCSPGVGTIENYLIQSEFTYGGDPPEDAPAINDSDLLVDDDDPGPGIAYAMYARRVLAATEAAMLNAVSARCHRFAFDVVGIIGRGTVPFFLNDEFTVAEADAILRNGVPGLISSNLFGNWADLANAIADRALSFFS